MPFFCPFFQVLLLQNTYTIPTQIQETTLPIPVFAPEDLRYISDAHLVYRGELNRFYHTYAKSIQQLEDSMPAYSNFA